jgi:hypothetical protein
MGCFGVVGRGKASRCKGGGGELDLGLELFTRGSPKQNTLARLPFVPAKFHWTLVLVTFSIIALFLTYMFFILIIEEKSRVEKHYHK